MDSELIDTPSALRVLLDSLPQGDEKPARLYVDLEGNDLSRNGTISLMAILVENEDKVTLIDITTLHQAAFNTSGSDGRTLRTVLEDSGTIKVFFDIRNDSDALYSLYDVKVDGIEDLQLMELASRPSSKRLVHGLAKCIQTDGTLETSQRNAWQIVKDKGRAMFDPARGGSYAVFDQRPLPSNLVQYCVQDVILMPHLRMIYRAKLCDEWWRKVDRETRARIALSQTKNYNGKGRHMAEGPREWLHWEPTREQKETWILLEQERLMESKAIAPSKISGSASASSSSHFNTETSMNKRAGERLPVTSTTALSMKDDPPGMPSMENNLSWNDGSWKGESERGWNSPSYSDEQDGGLRDLTACDKECGYCGSCLY